MDKKKSKKKSLAGKNEEAIRDCIVMKKPTNFKLLTSDEKVKFLIDNGRRLAKKFQKEGPSRPNKNLKKEPHNLGEKLIAKEGFIKKKCKNYLQLFNNILKNELLIDGSESIQVHRMKIRALMKKYNNNNMKLTDQNQQLKSKKKLISKIIIKKNKLLTNKLCDKDLLKPNKTRLSTSILQTIKRYQCDYCNKEFRRKFSLSRHMCLHLNIKSYSCAYCPKKFLYLTNAKIHEKRYHFEVTNDSGVYVCDLCKKPFLMKENLAVHIANHAKQRNTFKCVYCEKSYSHHVLLNAHEKQHLVSGKYQCTFCTISYEYRNELAAHVKGHLKIKDYICQYCGKTFVRLNSLKRHVQINHVGHRITCPICDKSLRGHLTEHMRTHERDRPHECPDCGQCFVQSTQLNVHRRSHTGYKPYKCRICNKKFTHSNALMLHIRRHTGEKPIICPLCPFKFSQLPHMKAHMRNIHGKDTPYRCEKCNQFFKLVVHLDNHMKSCKPEEKKVITPKKKGKLPALFAMSEEYQTNTASKLSRMRFLIALLFTMIASKEKLRCLGFNKRLIDEVLADSLEAMGKTPFVDETAKPLESLSANIEILLNNTVPKYQLEKFQKENKTTEQILELLTDEKKKE